MPVVPVAEPSRRVADLLRTAASTSASLRGFRPPVAPHPAAPDTAAAGPQVSRSGQPLSRAELAVFVGRAFAARDHHWQCAPAVDAGLVVLLSAAGVVDLPAGMYLAEVGEAVLFTPLGIPCVPSRWSRHPSLASVLVAADLRRVTGPTGTGYPGLLVQTGILAQFLSLAVMAGGRASLVETTFPGETTAAIGELHRGLRPMLAVTVQGGREAR